MSSQVSKGVAVETDGDEWIVQVLGGYATHETNSISKPTP